MHISFSPIRSDAVLPPILKDGEKLKIGRLVFDFSVIPPGADLPGEDVDPDFFVGTISRDDAGELSLTLLLPHGADASEAVRFPAPLSDMQDGAVPVPADPPTAATEEDADA